MKPILVNQKCQNCLLLRFFVNIYNSPKLISRKILSCRKILTFLHSDKATSCNFYYYIVISGSQFLDPTTPTTNPQSVPNFFPIGCSIKEVLEATFLTYLSECILVESIGEVFFLGLWTFNQTMPIEIDQPLSAIPHFTIHSDLFPSEKNPT